MSIATWGRKYIKSQEKIHRKAARGIWETIKRAILRFKDAIKRFKDRFKAGFKKAENRVQLWVNTLYRAETEGKVSAPPIAGIEMKFRWQLGGTEEHCETCLALSGVVMVASDWQKLGLRPQHPDLECGGWNCDCQLIESDAAAMSLADVSRKLGV